MLGAMTIAIPRFIALWMSVALCLICTLIAGIGAKLDDKTYITGFRREYLKWCNYYISILVLAIVGMKVKKTTMSENDVDYSYYLGQDYKAEKPRLGPNGKVSKIIAPHVSCFDVQTMGVATGGDMSFVAGAFIKGIPGLG